MNTKRKIGRYISGGIAGLVLVAFLIFQLANSSYRNRIPEYPGATYPSVELKDQIQNASNKAHRLPSAKNMGELGMVYHSSANYAEAAQCYRLAIQKRKSDWIWNYYLAHLNIEMGRPDVVVENLKRVLEINPGADLAWYYLGEAYGNLGENDQAERSFNKIVAINNVPVTKNTTRIDHFPLSAYAMFELSKIYLDNGNPELAEENDKKLIDRYELFGPAYRHLGNIYKMRGDISMGEEYNVRADDVYPVSPPVDTLLDQLALISRSDLYLLKKIDEASQNLYTDWGLRLVEHGFEYMPDNKFLVSKAIELYLRKGLYQKAAALKDQHSNNFKDNSAEMVRMGRLFFQNEMYDEAKDYLAISWSLNQENIEVLEHLAISTWNTGDKQEALDILREAAITSQDRPENLAVIAYTCLLFGKTEIASLYLNQLLKVAPQIPPVQKLAGKMAELRGNFAAAISFYESSFKGNPKDTETINSLGDLYLQFELWKKYLNLSEEVIKVHPNDPEFQNNLGSFLLACPDESIRNLDEGIYYSKRAFINILSGPPLKIAIGRNLAIVYSMKGDKNNAIKTIRQTIDIARKTNASTDIQQDLADIYQSIQE